MNSIKVSQLGDIAEGLNIEGGNPYYDLCKSNPCYTTIWINLVLVLDRPLIDNVTFQELDEKMKKNSYPLLENTVDNLNEHKMFGIYLMIIGYYLENGRDILCKARGPLNIIIHIHQDEFSGNLIKILKQYVTELCTFHNIDMNNIKIDYKTDEYTYKATKYNYENTDILLSFSQCAGLSSKLKPGDMIIPSIFIPYNIRKQRINKDQSYDVANHLMYSMERILESKFNMYSVNYVTNNYKSANLKKQNDKVGKLQQSDFFDGRILEVNELWNPTDTNELVNIKGDLFI